jgi:hypothetical protein
MRKHEMKRARPTKLVIVAVAALLIGSGNASLLSLRRSATLQSAILDRLTTSDYAGLVLLARDPSNQWDKVALPDESLAKVDPKIFAEMPWLSGHMDPNGLFAVIERQYPLYVSSRPLFGAISFALEEVWLRNPSDSQLRDRARALTQTVRAAFIAYHLKKEPKFQSPPITPEDDILNVWKKLGPGEFEMGAEDVTDREKPPHLVRVV